MSISNIPIVTAVCGVLLAVIVIAFVLSESFRRDVTKVNPGDNTWFGIFSVSGAIIVVLCGLFIGGMVIPYLLGNWVEPRVTPNGVLLYNANGKLLDGEICNEDEDCNSHCFPGPSTIVSEETTKYCISRPLDCALPKTSGAELGTEIHFGGAKLKCGNPTNGSRSRFTSANFLK